MSEAERLRELIDYLGVTLNKFAKNVGGKQSTVFKFVSGENPVSMPFLNKVLEVYPVNREWLYFGEGKMFAEDYFQSRWNERKSEPKTIVDKLKYLQWVYDCSEASLAARLGISRSFIGKVMKGEFGISDQKKNEFALKIRFIPRDWWDE